MAEAAPPPLDEGGRRWALLTAAVCLAPLLLQLPGVTAAAIGATAIAITALSWRRPLSNPVRGLLAIAIVVAVAAQFGFQFGRDTGCALLGAMLALKPSETRSLRDARSLVGFALFAPFSTFLLDQGPASLVLGLAGAILALGVLQRLAAIEGGMSATGIAMPLRQALRLLLVGRPLALAGADVVGLDLGRALDPRRPEIQLKTLVPVDDLGLLDLALLDRLDRDVGVDLLEPPGSRGDGGDEEHPDDDQGDPEEGPSEVAFDVHRTGAGRPVPPAGCG
jgi:hypothetical protein